MSYRKSDEITTTFGSIQLAAEQNFELGQKSAQKKIDDTLRLAYVMWAGHNDYAKEALKGVIKNLAPDLYAELLQIEIEQENKKDKK